MTRRPEKKERLVTFPVTFEFSLYVHTYTKEEAKETALATFMEMTREERLVSLNADSLVEEDGVGGVVGSPFVTEE